MHHARGAPARARASREGRRDEPTVNNSGSKLKIRLVGPPGNRETLLSRPFLGPRGNFSKSYDENRFAQNRSTW